ARGYEALVRVSRAVAEDLVEPRPGDSHQLTEPVVEGRIHVLEEHQLSGNRRAIEVYGVVENQEPREVHARELSERDDIVIGDVIAHPHEGLFESVSLLGLHVGEDGERDLVRHHAMLPWSRWGAHGKRAPTPHRV